MPDYLHWLRSRIGHRKIILAYAAALIRDDEGRLLFQRRTDFDWWGLPGGVLEIGETFGECVVREAEEETGWRVQPVRLVGIYTSPDYDVLYPNGDQVQQFSAAYECRIVGGASRPDGAEATAHRFFAADELPALHVPRWYGDMARDGLRPSGGGPRFDPPQFDGASREEWRDLRGLIGTGRLIAPGAGAIIQDRDGRILLGLRREGLWGIPAGLMERGESISGTLVREAREEMSVDIAPRELIGVYTGPEFFHTYPDGNQVQIVSTLFRAEITGGQLKPDGVETLDLQWFDPAQLPPDMPPRHRKLVIIGLKALSREFRE